MPVKSGLRGWPQLVLILTMHAGCIDGNASTVQFGSPASGLDLLDRGSDSGYPAKDPSALVIAEQQAWKQFWSQHTIHDKPAPALPVIDWKASAVVALVHGRANTGGHSIYPESAIATDAGLLITYKIKHPGEGCIVNQGQTNPFYLGLIPAAHADEVTWKRIVFQADAC